MKKLMLVFTLLASLFLSTLVGQVYAQEAGSFDLDKFNKTIFGAKGPIEQFNTPGGILTYLLNYLFTFAGLILFVMIIWGGFEMLTGAANPKSQEAGKQRMTAGIIGFILIFSAYWMTQILQTIFGLNILG